MILLVFCSKGFWGFGALVSHRSDTAPPSRPLVPIVDGTFWSVSLPVAPWFSMGRQFLIHCDQGFILKLESMEIRGGKIDGSTTDCEDTMSTEEARRILLSHLEKKGYSWK